LQNGKYRFSLSAKLKNANQEKTRNREKKVAVKIMSPSKKRYVFLEDTRPLFFLPFFDVDIAAFQKKTIGSPQKK
jgi:hypothetical protein